MNEILGLAAKLGKLIKADSRAERMAKAREALEGSAADHQLLGDYEKVQAKIRELQATGSPIEPEEKRNLADLHAKMAASELVKELLKAQMDYTELMSGVIGQIEKEAVG